MKSQLCVQALWEDDGLLTISSSAASFGFTGQTQVYTTCGELEKWAKEIESLSLEVGHTVEFQAGARSGYAYLGVTISVLDILGHCVCKVSFESNSIQTWERKNKLEIEIGIEPSALDRFVPELMAIVHTHQGEACLLGIDTDEYDKNVA